MTTVLQEDRLTGLIILKGEIQIIQEITILLPEGPTPLVSIQGHKCLQEIQVLLGTPVHLREVQVQ